MAHKEFFFDVIKRSQKWDFNEINLISKSFNDDFDELVRLAASPLENIRITKEDAYEKHLIDSILKIKHQTL